MKNKKKIVLRVFCVLVCLGILSIGAVFGINAFVK